MSMYKLADKKVTGDTLLTRAKEYINDFYKNHGRDDEISARWVLSYYIKNVIKALSGFMISLLTLYAPTASFAKSILHLEIQRVTLNPDPTAGQPNYVFNDNICLWLTPRKISQVGPCREVHQGAGHIPPDRGGACLCSHLCLEELPALPRQDPVEEPQAFWLQVAFWLRVYSYSS